MQREANAQNYALYIVKCTESSTSLWATLLTTAFNIKLKDNFHFTFTIWVLGVILTRHERQWQSNKTQEYYPMVFFPVKSLIENSKVH